MTPDDELSEWESDDEAPTVHTRYQFEVAKQEQGESENEADSLRASSDEEYEYDYNEYEEVATREVVIKTNNVGSLRMLMDSFYRFNKMNGRHVIKAVSATTGRVTLHDVNMALTTECRTIYCLRTDTIDKMTLNKAKVQGVKILQFEVFHQLLDAIFEPFFEEVLEENSSQGSISA